MSFPQISNDTSPDNIPCSLVVSLLYFNSTECLFIHISTIIFCSTLHNRVESKRFLSLKCIFLLRHPLFLCYYSILFSFYLFIILPICLVQIDILLYLFLRMSITQDHKGLSPYNTYQFLYLLFCVAGTYH